MSYHPLHYRRVIVLAVFVGAVVAVSQSDTLHHALVDILSVARSVMQDHPIAGMLLFLLLSGLSAMLTFFSSTALVPVGVYVWGPEKTFALLLMGGVLGGSAGYWIARTLGRRVVKRLYPGAPFRRYESFFRSGAHWRTIMLFRLALQSELPSYVLGLVRYPFPKYLPMIVLGELPFVFVVVYLGEAFLERNGIAFAVVLGVAVVLMVLAFLALQREMRETHPA